MNSRIDDLRTAHPSWTWSQDGDAYIGKRGLATIRVTLDAGVWRAQWEIPHFGVALGLSDSPVRAVNRALTHAGVA